MSRAEPGQVAEFLRAAKGRSGRRRPADEVVAVPEARPSEARVCWLTAKRPSESNDRSRLASSRPSSVAARARRVTRSRRNSRCSAPFNWPCRSLCDQSDCSATPASVISKALPRCGPGVGPDWRPAAILLDVGRRLRVADTDAESDGTACRRERACGAAASAARRRSAPESWLADRPDPARPAVATRIGLQRRQPGPIGLGRLGLALAWGWRRRRRRPAARWPGAGPAASGVWIGAKLARAARRRWRAVSVAPRRPSSASWASAGANAPPSPTASAPRATQRARRSSTRRDRTKAPFARASAA